MIKSLKNREDIALTDYCIFNVIQLDLGSCVLADKNILTCGNDHFHFVAVNHSAGAYFNDLVYFRLFLRRSSEKDTGRCALFCGVLLQNNSVSQGF